MSHIKNRIRNRLIDFGINGVRNSKGRRVLMYHGVDLLQSTRFNGRFISDKNFEEQICYYKKHFNILSLEDYFKQKPSSDKFEIAITFDDGLQNNFKYALPILEKHKVPATFFVTGINKTKENILWGDLINIATALTGKDFEFNNIHFIKDKITHEYLNASKQTFSQLFKEDKREMEVKIKEMLDCLIDSKDDFRLKEEYWDYWKLMSDEEIAKTAKSKYVKIGSHGMYHNNLGLQALSKSVNELKLSKAYLGNLTNYEIKSIAYPDGSYSRELIEEANKLGYEQQCAVHYLFEEDKTDNRIVDRHEVRALQIPENKYRVGYNIVKPF